MKIELDIPDDLAADLLEEVRSGRAVSVEALILDLLRGLQGRRLLIAGTPEAEALRRDLDAAWTDREGAVDGPSIFDSLLSSNPSSAVDPLSEAVVAYIGFGTSPFPHRNVTALVSKFGPGRATELERAVIGILDEAGSIDIRWAGRTLQDAARDVTIEMSRRHPDLSNSAIKAIIWDWSYSWR